MQRAQKSDLQKLRIIRKRADFLAMNKHGQKWVSRGVIVQVMPNETGDIRVGYTVSKKVDKSAVKRNRIKRRLRAAAADVLAFQAKDSHDYVLIGRPMTALRPYEDLAGDLAWCLKKLGVCKE